MERDADQEDHCTLMRKNKCPKCAVVCFDYSAFDDGIQEKRSWNVEQLCGTPNVVHRQADHFVRLA